MDQLQVFGQYVWTHFTPLNIVLLVLLVINTVIAENPRIKGSSLYGIFKAALFTLKDQTLPQPVAVETVVAQPSTEQK